MGSASTNTQVQKVYQENIRLKEENKNLKNKLRTYDNKYNGI
jgi:hypothetical protein